MIPTIEQWTRLGLQKSEFSRWELLPEVTRLRVRAVRSVVQREGWLVLYPNPSDMRVDIVIGERLAPQRARDIADWLKDRLDLSVGEDGIPLFKPRVAA